MSKNIYSLGLLRNGKVYPNKQLAIQGLTQIATNDGVAKLARYLYVPENSNGSIIRTIVGFYANAAEMEEASGGTSSYTILDVEGSAADIAHIQEEINEINNVIGDGIEGKTLTQAINDANAAIVAESEARENAIELLESALTESLTISLNVAGVPTEGYLKTYELKQGGNLVGKIDIPKDMVVSGGSLVHGTWSGSTFTEDPDGPDTAIKIEFANADTIYINTKDLVDYYTAGNAAITINNTSNTIALKLDEDGEAFLSITENGLKLSGVQTAINKAVSDAELSAGDGISIVDKIVKSVAATNSAPGIVNPITVDEDGIKFASSLECGFWDIEP